MSHAVIRFDDATIAYEGRAAVRGATGAFAAGSLTAVVGPNGAGKSTLIKTIIGLLKPQSGAVSLSGVDRRDIAHLPQLAAIDDSFPISVLDVALMGHWRRVGAFGRIGPDLRAQALQALADVGLSGFEGRLFGSLSAGQRQRVLFARVMVADSPLILLDEPFATVDQRTTSDLLRLIAHWHQQGRTVIAVLHDFEQVREHFPETLLLARQVIGWGPTSQVMTDGNLRRARALSEDWDAAQADLSPETGGRA